MKIAKRCRKASLSTDSELKEALSIFCKKHGLKIQSVAENTIHEQFEDEIDLANYQKRKNEEEIPLAKVLKKSKNDRY